MSDQAPPPASGHRLFKQSSLLCQFCTRNRQRIPDLEKAQAAIETYARRGVEDFGAALGRYVVMADYIHLFVCGDFEFALSKWMAGLDVLLRVVDNTIKVR